MVLAGGLLGWQLVRHERREDAAAEQLRRAAIRGAMPPFDAALWEVEEQAPLDDWSAWQLATYRPGQGVVCWRFLVLPRGASATEAFDESLGLGGCSADRSQRYEIPPAVRACQLLGRVPPWKARYTAGADFDRSACAGIES